MTKILTKEITGCFDCPLKKNVQVIDNIHLKRGYLELDEKLYIGELCKTTNSVISTEINNSGKTLDNCPLKDKEESCDG